MCLPPDTLVLTSEVLETLLTVFPSYCGEAVCSY
jgi:hypothetical protein